MEKHTPVNHSKEWLDLAQHHKEIRKISLTDFFAQDPKRFNACSKSAASLIFDFSNNHCSRATLELLFRLAKRVDLETAIDNLLAGKIVNQSEGRAALHTALRDHNGIFVLDPTIHNLVQDSQRRMAELVCKVRAGEYFGFSGKPIKHIVNIGIGGSDLGPKMVWYALRPYQDVALDFHFVSNVDRRDIQEALTQCDPATTLFIIASKSFTTEETLQNLSYAQAWLARAADGASTASQWIAVTTAVTKAQQYGFSLENCLPFWDWVGGRYSVWSAVGVSIAFAIGMSKFQEFLAGAHAMDQHFKSAAFSDNLPVLMALIGVWYNNFFNYQSRAVIPYSQALKYLPDYLQQLYMESLGKSVHFDGSPVEIATGYVLWGNMGTNSQHSFHQLLMQGTQSIPIDFVLPLKNTEQGSVQDEMIANCLAQSRVFTQGYVPEEMNSVMHQQCKIAGNRPHNLLLLERMDPAALGALIALYEHKVYVQSVIWGVNAFDQWGVQRGKVVAKTILAELKSSRQKSEATSLVSRIADEIYG